ncbi:lipopolysaccharide biosynthesis protein [Enterococcus avium]|uniref:lipopolysaccharide biosynthesis protein n=1 Tax=Enterococcus avium TaxID=33945 RepID=UPI0028918B31|nr:transporter [Enterococcus avium]MDT2391071.1 transporter [Enterococcus avium]
MNRTKLALMNTISSSSVYAVRMIITFLTRALFIQKLGVELLGIQGVFTNILSVLSLAELGFGSTLALVLYKPLADNDSRTVSSLMKMFRKIYLFVGLIVLTFGLIVIPFLPLLGKEFELTKIGGYYLLFLANSVVSYFFTYKRTLLNANQRGYLTSVNDIVFWLIVQLLQVIVLLTSRSYYLFLVIQIIGTILSNLSISKIVDRQFSKYVDYSENLKVTKDQINEVKRNTVGSMSAKLGNIVVTSTDNLLISAFVSVSAVGMFSNYSLIVTSGVQALLTNLLFGLTPSIGNYIYTKDLVDVKKLYETITFYGFSLLIYCVPALILATPSFIVMWLGNDLLLSSSILACLIANLCLSVNRLVTTSFINAYGLAWYARKRPILEAIANLFFSLTFLKVFNLGILGVVFGTIVSSLFIGFWYELKVLSIYGLKTDFRYLVRINLGYLIKLLVLGIVSYFIGTITNTFIKSTISEFLINLTLAIITSSIFFLVVSNREQKKNILDKVKNVVGRKKSEI